MEDISFIIPHGANQRLDATLAAAMPLSRARLQALIIAGHVRIDGVVVMKPSLKVKAGQTLEITLPPLEDLPLEGENIPLDVLFEDTDIIVLNKPKGLVVHPAPGHWTGTLVHALLYHCQDLSGIGDVKRPGIVHRLDKDTSGVMVVAKNDFSHASLAAQFQDHGRTGVLERVYQTLVYGELPLRGTVSAPLGRDRKSRIKMAVNGVAAREAISHYERLAVFGQGTAKLSLCAVTLETGRTHQVRVHMAHIGCPVVNDPLYATAYKTKLKPLGLEAFVETVEGQFLHAKRLKIHHPRTLETLTFETPLPLYFQNMLQTLEAGHPHP